jgi:hypothetical protein
MIRVVLLSLFLQACTTYRYTQTIGPRKTIPDPYKGMRDPIFKYPPDGWLYEARR